MRVLSPPLKNALNPFTTLFKTSTRCTSSPSPQFRKTHFRVARMASTTTIASKTPATEPTFSSNYNPEQGLKDLQPLLRANGGKWVLIESGKGVERGFKFKTFKKTWEFMNLVAAECAVKKHHPEWSNVYNTTFIRWTTHSPPGLSEKDVVMARFCDEKAGECGEAEVAVEGGGGGGGGVGKELVDRVAVEGGDCCVPKGKGKSG